MSTGNPSNLPADLAALNLDVSAAEAQLTALQSQVTNLQATVATQTAQLAADATLIAQLEAELHPNVAPTFTADTPPNPTVGTPYSYTFAASGTPTPTFVETGLPPGLTFTGATLSGTPTATGSTTVVVTASNTAGSVTSTSTLTVAAAALPDVVVTAVSFPTTINVGDHVTFGCTVKNQGAGPTPAGVVVGVAFDVDGAEATWSDNYSASITPGGTVTLTADNGVSGVAYWTATAGTHTLVADVNDIGRFAESNTGNNTFTATFTVAAVVVPPPPPVTGTAPNNTTGTPTTLLADNAMWGIHYMPAPTITVIGQNNAINQSGTGAVAINATSWQVVDINGFVVGSGTTTASTSSLTVCSSGTWVGGSTAVPGYYTVVGNTGAVGNVVICPPTKLYQPTTSSTKPSFSGWMASAGDRDFYAIPQIDDTVYSTGTAAAAAIIAELSTDGYRIAPQDPARPRKLWIAPSTQSNYPTQGPTSTYWGQLAAGLVAGGHAGAYYELATNEYENGGWSIANLIPYWNACADAVLAADPTAHCMGPDSGGYYNDSPISSLATFLAGCPRAQAITNHMENSNQNLADFVSLRAYYAGMKAQAAASGVPNIDYWNTETGIEGGQYGVIHPRRDARQRTLIRLVAESFGWAKENQYDFEVFDHHGSGLPMYIVDQLNGNNNGNMRGGAYAIHVLSEALFGTTCNPTNIPAKLGFGSSGSAADSLFMGLHYKGTTQDVVVLATNGITSASVTLNVGGTGSVTYWDGMGVPGTATVSSGQITVPVNDLLTYVFLPLNSTVSVVDTDQGAVALSSATDLAVSATVVNAAGTAVPSVHNGNWGENNSGVTGVNAPYKSSTVPDSMTVTLPSAQTIAGFAFKGPAPAWQTAGSSVITYTVTVDGAQVYTSTDASAVSYAIPSASNGNSSDPCTRTTWWASRYSDIRKLATPVTGTVFKLTVSATGYGGQPDSAASTNSTASYHEGSPQQWQLAELAVFS